MVYVVDDGLEYTARYVMQETAGSFKWLALDAGATVEAHDTTALTSEVLLYGGARALATISYEHTGTYPSDTHKAVWVYTFSFSGITGYLAIKGCGCFNQLAVGGKMLMCHAFAADKNVENGETMQLTMKINYAR